MIGNFDAQYQILNNILDSYVFEGQRIGRRKNQYDTSTEDKLNGARARAYIHLYLASVFGILDFEKRELIITDGSNDGGIDAYYIDEERKVINIIQSKYRIGSSNFQSKYIDTSELASMDVNNILRGNKTGVIYNGFIQRLIEKITKIQDIARYRYRIVLLANVKPDQKKLICNLFPEFEVEVIDYNQSYKKLVLPVLRGEQHYNKNLRLQIDVSNKTTSRLEAKITTIAGLCNLLIVLVPTLEIARVLSKYKNSLLRYNPRSYLEFAGQSTNESIRKSITDTNTGDFAILNNGITIVADEAYINEMSGAPGRANVEIVNPQIVNGGQTAFTLSRIYEETSESDEIKKFQDKEVIVKIIAVPKLDEEKQRNFLFKISESTNTQTAVSSADRNLNTEHMRDIADNVFMKTGLLFEPKKGEYHYAINMNFIKQENVIERTLFIRIVFAAAEIYSVALSSKITKKIKGNVPSIDDFVIEKVINLLSIYNKLEASNKKFKFGFHIVESIAAAILVYEIRKNVENSERAYEDNLLLPVAHEVLYKIFEEVSEKSMSSDGVNLSSKNAKTAFRRYKSWIAKERFINDIRHYILDNKEKIPNLLLNLQKDDYTRN